MESMIVVITLIVWITSCLAFYFFGKGDQRNLTKFIGGFVVILVAILADNQYVYLVSVIIAGLIIASERFMSVLVALLRSNPDIWKSDNFIKMIEKMSAEEIENKKQQEAKEIEEATNSELQPILRTKKANVKMSKYIQSLVGIEMKALSKYERRLNIKIDRQVKVSNLLFDGLYMNNSKNTVYFFEVKVIPDFKKTAKDGDLADSIIRRLKVTIPNLLLSLNNQVLHELYPKYNHAVLMIIIVVDSDRNLDKIMETVDTLRHIYNQTQQNISVRFSFYNSTRLDL